MAHRLKPVHKSARPLFDLIEIGKFTRNEVAEHFDLDTQNVTNWFARGVPFRRQDEVATLCGMSIEEYRYVAGLTKKKPPKLNGADDKIDAEVVRATSELHRMPRFLQHYMSRKIGALLRHYEAVPEFMRDKLDPPDDAEQYRQWESEIEALVLHLAKFEAKPVKRQQKLAKLPKSSRSRAVHA